MYDVMTLVCEHYKDGVEQTKERERGEEWEKTCHQKFFGGQIPNSGAGYDACNKWDAQVLQSCETSQMMERIGNIQSRQRWPRSHTRRELQTDSPRQ